MWGVTSRGGEFGAGVIFKTDAAGENQEVKHSFFATEGVHPLGEITVYNGLYYGLTSHGGENSRGLLFAFNPETGEQTTLFEFEDATSGRDPEGSVVVIDDVIYGMSKQSGPGSFGVLFAFDLGTSSFTNLVDFNQDNGGWPQGGLTDVDGVLYGLTTLGGEGNRGVMFNYEIATSTFTILHHFDDAQGWKPYGDLTLYDNKLYGATYHGGSGGAGVLYYYDLATSTYTEMYDLNGTSEGKNPQSALTIHNDIIYGTTDNGGMDNYGVFYQYNLADGVFTTLQTFDLVTTGREPAGKHALYNGKIYGANRVGTVGLNGLLYVWDPVATTFTILLEPGQDYMNTEGGLIEENGQLISLAKDGAFSGGSLNRFDISTNTTEKLLDFDFATQGGSMGQSLTYFNGKLYGITAHGENGVGALIEFDPATGDYEAKVHFGGDSTSGFESYCTMVVLNDKLYGTTANGGTEGGGVIFEYDPIADVYLDIMQIPLTSGLTIPGSHMIVFDDILYGLNTALGEFNGGTLWTYDPTINELTKKFDFEEVATGRIPTGKLLESNGLLYGTTLLGGVNGSGTLFSYDPTTELVTKLFDFEADANGAQPVGGLVELDGKIYGVARTGGTSGHGVLFEFDPVTNLLNPETHFTEDSEGFKPIAGLLVSEGVLFGLAQSGGENSLGVMYSYNPATDTYAKKVDFDIENGSYPTSTSLILIPSVCTNTSSEIEPSVCESYTTPSGSDTYFESGNYADVLVGQNVCGADSIIQINLTILEPTAGVDLQTACESYTWIDNNTYTESNMLATHMLINAAGCDSLVTLNLVINQPTAGTDAQTACSTFTWIDGNTYLEDNNSATHLLTNAAGCDSLVTLDLTINTVNVSVTQDGVILTADELGADYQWLNCPEMDAIIDASNQTFTATSNGTYAVIVTNTVCADTSACYTVTDVGILENEFGNALQVFPNPTFGEFSIDLAGPYERVTVRITDMAGKLIREANYSKSQLLKLTIDEPAGLYILHIKAGEKKAIIRLVKE